MGVWGRVAILQLQASRERGLQGRYFRCGNGGPRPGCPARTSAWKEPSFGASRGPWLDWPREALGQTAEKFAAWTRGTSDSVVSGLILFPPDYLTGRWVPTHLPRGRACERLTSNEGSHGQRPRYLITLKKVWW